jgi:hypothetical protein
VVPSAIFIRRDQVETMLDRPLRDTLASPTPSFGSVATSSMAALLKQLPGYAYQLEPASDLSVLFMLSDLNSAASSAATATTPQTSTTPQSGTTTTPQSGTTTPQTTTTPQQGSKGKSGQRGG